MRGPNCDVHLIRYRLDDAMGKLDGLGRNAREHRLLRIRVGQLEPRHLSCPMPRQGRNQRTGGTTSTGGANSGGAANTGGAAAGGANGTGGATSTGGVCSSDQDCPASYVCGYQADLTCSVGAQCIPASFCNSVAVGCGCDGGIALVGCGVSSKPFTGIGPCANNGTGGAPSTAIPVSVTQLFGVAVPQCPAGYEHPNICCQGAPYQATACTEDLTHPFGLCESEQLAYPDPNACCSLDNKTDCVQPSGVDSTPDAGQQNNCQNPCSPGAYPPPPLMDGWLCVFGIGMSAEPTQPVLRTSCTVPIDWCSNPCPAGWSAPVGGQVDLCCQTGSGGQSFCFSQAALIGGNRGGGVGTMDPDWIFEWFANDGNSYVEKCDSTSSPACSCIVNGVVTQTTSDNECTAKFVPCGFPQD